MQIRQAEEQIKKLHPLTSKPINDLLPAFKCFKCSFDSVTNRTSKIEEDDDADCSVIEQNQLLVHECLQSTL